MFGHNEKVISLEAELKRYIESTGLINLKIRNINASLQSWLYILIVQLLHKHSLILLTRLLFALFLQTLGPIFHVSFKI